MPSLSTIALFHDLTRTNVYVARICNLAEMTFVHGMQSMTILLVLVQRWWAKKSFCGSYETRNATCAKSGDVTHRFEVEIHYIVLSQRAKLHLQCDHCRTNSYCELWVGLLDQLCNSHFVQIYSPSLVVPVILESSLLLSTCNHFAIYVRVHGIFWEKLDFSHPSLPHHNSPENGVSGARRAILHDRSFIKPHVQHRPPLS